MNSLTGRGLPLFTDYHFARQSTLFSGNGNYIDAGGQSIAKVTESINSFIEIPLFYHFNFLINIIKT
jgi:hypothetical protein